MTGTREGEPIWNLDMERTWDMIAPASFDERVDELLDAQDVDDTPDFLAYLRAGVAPADGPMHAFGEDEPSRPSSTLGIGTPDLPRGRGGIAFGWTEAPDGLYRIWDEVDIERERLERWIEPRPSAEEVAAQWRASHDELVRAGRPVLEEFQRTAGDFIAAASESIGRALASWPASEPQDERLDDSPMAAAIKAKRARGTGPAPRRLDGRRGRG